MEEWNLTNFFIGYWLDIENLFDWHDKNLRRIRTYDPLAWNENMIIKNVISPNTPKFKQWLLNKYVNVKQDSLSELN